MTPFESAVVSVDGGVEGTAAGVGSSTPGSGSVSGRDTLDDPPNILDSQPPAVLAPSDIAGRALACAAAAVLKQRPPLSKPR